ncbi:MAG: lytic transglycosylase domain-containing protein [Verrucomicrobia bacterium]|nr:lytic transglycosylase domain-containing protein [Verrucomicrobiota bacterium]MBU1736084.1 lytic transglycosylase domain-containing protein [Verrucomicrobiota bacterium]MBU1855525.1 lytic transglycosylase domain-containing protein [Verrucomicrobiota bacterium]
MGFVLGIVMLLAVVARTERVLTPEDLLDNADISSLEQSLLENLPPELELPDAEDWQSFWNQVEIILQSQSLDDMTWFCSTVQQVCGYLDADPATQPWADWLRQRLDYFEMASVAVQEVPSEPVIPIASAPSTPPAPSPATPKVKPSPPPSPAVTPTKHKVFHLVTPGTPPAKAPVSLQVQSKRHSLVRNSSRWQKKLANRPAPPNAAALIPRLKKVFRSEGLPPELVWMAEVESSLNPAARSPVGALGLFQLMPATARRFGLRTGFFDERKDPEKSARAAAQYLKFLYHAMGSWPLALAAYNAGEGRVGKIVKRKKQDSFEGIADDLPMETQMYVPKVMALISLRENTAPEKLPGPVIRSSLNQHPAAVATYSLQSTAYNLSALFIFEPLFECLPGPTERSVYACNSEVNRQNAQVYWPEDLPYRWGTEVANRGRL